MHQNPSKTIILTKLSKYFRMAELYVSVVLITPLSPPCIAGPICCAATREDSGLTSYISKILEQ